MSRLALAAASCGIFAALLPAQLRSTAVATGLDQPVYVTTPDGDLARLFIVERSGRILILKDGAVLGTPFLDIRSRVRDNDEAGLVGLAFHPRYAGNGFFYVNYNDLATGATIIERYRVSADPDIADPDSATAMLDPIPQLTDTHNGGCLRFGPDGYLYIGIGDGGLPGDPSCQAQNRQSLLGKLLRIDVDNPLSRIPPDNPFVGDPSTRGEIWALGLRNPWRFSFDRVTGDLFLGDVGEGGREEVNFQSAFSRGGENYGWNTMEGRECFAPVPCDPAMPACNDPRLTLPILDYARSSEPGCQGAVVGGYVYRGCEILGLRGTYFFGDFCTGRVFTFRLVNGLVTDLRDRTAELDQGLIPVTGFGEDANGELYITSYFGDVFRIDGTDLSVPEESPASFSTFGNGCSGSVGVPTLDAVPGDFPWVGEGFEIRLSAMPRANLSLPFGVLGLSRSQWEDSPLPLDLTGSGFPGCTQFVSADYWFPLVNHAGETVWNLEIPCDNNLVGLTFYVQGVVLDLLVPGNVVLTNAAQGVVGVRGKQRQVPLGEFRFGTAERVGR